MLHLTVLNNIYFSIFEADDSGNKKQKYPYEHFKNRISTLVGNKTNVTPQGVSTAMDARLETGVELSAELRLKVYISCP